MDQLYLRQSHTPADLDHDGIHGGTPGRATLTSRLAATPQVVFRVADPDTARALGESLSGQHATRDLSRGSASRDGNGVADGAQAAVADAAQSSGGPLREDLRVRFEQSLNADLSAVRVHTGSESIAASKAVGAKAYTVGNDIHFGAGQYQPDDPFGMHLIAHEVAHTVQQSGAVAQRQHKLEVSTPQDGAEVEADRAADAMVSGRSAQVTSRPSLSLDRKGTEHMGGDASTGDNLVTQNTNGSTLTYQPGERGYSGVMLGQSELTEDSLAQDSLLPRLTPDLSELNSMISKQATIVGHYKTEQEGPSSVFSVGDGQRQALLQGSGRQARVEARLKTLYTQREEIAAKFNGWNSWVAFPNRTITSLEALDLMKQNLGVSDEAGMLAKMRAGVTNAREVIAKAKEDEKSGKGAPEYADLQQSVPAEDQSVETQSGAVTGALSAMTTSYSGFRSTVLKAEQSAEGDKGEKDKARKTQIEGIKQSIQTACAAIDTGVALVSGAPGKMHSLIEAGQSAHHETLGKKKALLSAMKKSEVYTKGIDADYKWSETQTFDEAWKASAGQTPAASPVAEKPASNYDVATPPEGSGGVVGKITGAAADLYYEKELLQIAKNLNVVSAKVGELGNQTEAALVTQKVADFRDKLAAFSKAWKDLNDRVQARKRKYTDFGVKLDDLARRYRAKLDKGQAPADNQEMYATLFTVGAQILEITSMGKESGNAGQASGDTGTGASGGYTSHQVRGWWNKMRRGRNENRHSDEPEFGMGRETDAISTMMGACRSWETTQQRVTNYKAIAGEIKSLMAEMQGGGKASGKF
jgi:Domain of unknown function (DUF4157)